MLYVIAIDVGVQNLGLCVFDFNSTRVVEWDNVSLVQTGRYMPSQNVLYVRSFLQRYEKYFGNANQVLIERQMRCNMRIIEAVIQALYFEKCTIISPRAVKLHYDLSTKTYKGNKKSAVLWARKFVNNNANVVSAHCVERFHKLQKQDDMADSLLLLMFYLDTYSNQMATNTELHL